MVDGAGTTMGSPVMGLEGRGGRGVGRSWPCSGEPGVF